VSSTAREPAANVPLADQLPSSSCCPHPDAAINTAAYQVVPGVGSSEPCDGACMPVCQRLYLNNSTMEPGSVYALSKTLQASN